MNAIQTIEKIDEIRFLEFETNLRKNSPGLILAVQLFRERFPNAAIAETHIRNIVIEKEVTLLERHKNLSTFLKRNGLDGFESLTEKEKRLFQKS